MNYAHLHLVLTHFPPVLSLGGALSAAAGLLLPRHRRHAVRAALLLLIAIGVMMPPIYFIGDRAADSIGRVEGIQQDAIAPHQRAATIAMVASLGIGAIAATVLAIEARRGDSSPQLRVLVFAMAITSFAVIAWTATLGGAIHHPEASYRSADVEAGAPPFTSWTSSATLDDPVTFPFASVRG